MERLVDECGVNSISTCGFQGAYSLLRLDEQSVDVGI